MKTILLIGGNGLIGRSIYDYFSKKYQIKILDIKGNSKKILKADISNKKKIHKVLNNFLLKKKIDIVINASYPKTNHFLKDPLKSDTDVIIKNYKSHFIGYFIITQFFCNYFKKRKIKGNIINFASIYSKMLPRFNIYKKNQILTPVEYGMIKSNIVYTTKYFAKYVLGTGIRINCISPGGVIDKQSKFFVKNYSSFTNSKKMMNKNDFNYLLEYLIENKSMKITGQNFVIDDGFSLWVFWTLKNYIVEFYLTTK